MLSNKKGKKISETLFYHLKKEAIAKRGESEQWLYYYARYQVVEFYGKRIEKLEYIQRNLLKVLVEETQKEEEKQKDKTIINQLSKNNAENYSSPSCSLWQYRIQLKVIRWMIL